ncbi:TVP38/TMEM64 family protein [Paenibacillus oleatilyticus]|uniref:TVP38/TMEM64 family protein n=1 Tax=Paenibacillus oleatilyticus TaxID=2594886 RepID=UPI001C1F850B|nr:TVP38/TMEM64 family protein [Paenibacillus oleatilyticus]MBU7319985.1 TVP38/TMEM64 family protein [Paenibacillus oleatilyticus]
MFKKISLALLYAVMAFLIYRYGEEIVGWFQSSSDMALVIVAATVMALFPVIPYPVVGGVIGAAFGPVLGAAITWAGSTAASLLMFLFVRYGYQEWGQRMLYRYERLGKLTVLFERNAFLTILFARLIPFLPSIIINAYSALSRVSFAAYAAASALGKIPAMLLFAFVGNTLMTEPGAVWITLGIYGGFLAVTLLAYRQWKRSKEPVQSNRQA